MKIFFVAPSVSPHFIRWRDRVSSHPLCTSTSVYDQSLNMYGKKLKYIRLFVSSSVNDLNSENQLIFSNSALVIKRYILNPIQFSVEFTAHFALLLFKLRYSKPEIIHVHWLNSVASLAAVFVGKILSIPIILTAWGSDINDLFTAKNNLIFRKYLIKLQLRNANHITCDAIHLAERMMELGITKDKISIIRFGTDTKYFKKSTDQSFLRRQFGFEESDFVILSNRPFEEVYDIDTIVRAVHKFKDITEQFKLILIGRGSREESIRNLVSSLALERNTVFKGYLSDEEFLNYIQLSNVYISAAKSDGGIAASTAEAMACEKVCVVTDFGENSNWVIEGKTGYLFDIGSESQLYLKLSTVHNNRDNEVEIGVSARKMIVENLNLNLELEKTMTLYLKIGKIL